VRYRCCLTSEAERRRVVDDDDGGETQSQAFRPIELARVSIFVWTHYKLSSSGERIASSSARATRASPELERLETASPNTVPLSAVRCTPSMTSRRAPSSETAQQPLETALDDARRLARMRRQLRSATPLALPCARRAAVACLLRTDATGRLELLFIKRAVRRGDAWSGDVGFPGGMLKPGELELEAACRETHEEIGVDVRSWELLGPLDDRPAARSRGAPTLVVRTFVFLQPPGDCPPLTLEASEVAAAWWVPLSLLVRPPQPLPLFRVPASRLVTRFPALRNASVARLAALLGLDCALFPFVALPPPPAEVLSRSHSVQTRLWGVTLGLVELLMCAADGADARLKVQPWRMRSPMWRLVCWLLLPRGGHSAL